MNPLGVGKLKSEKDGENVFFRRKLSGDLVFIDADFNSLLDLEQSEERCVDIQFRVERKCGEEWELYWPGIFSLNEAKWNLSKCTVSVSIRPDDAYRKIIDYYSKEYNVLEVPASDTVKAKLDFTGQFEFRDITGDTIMDQDEPNTWAVFLQERYWIDGDWNTQGKYQFVDVIFRLVTVRDFVNGFPPELNTWTLIDANYSTQKAKYAKAPDLYNFKPYVYRYQGDFNKYPDLKQIPCNGAYDEETYVRAYNLNNPDGCYNIRTDIDSSRWVSLVWEFGAFYFDRNRKLLEVINHLLKKVYPEAAHVESSAISQFFSAAQNYATNAPSKVKDLLIAQRSDIVSWNSSEPASKGMASLKNILEALRDMFQVYWFLDAGGKFRLEHISFFESVGVNDFTVPKYAPYLEGMLQYEYEKTKMPRFERLVFNDTESDDFALGLIEYQSACVNYEEGQDTREKNISIFTTDLENLLVNASGSRTGFVLISHENGIITKEEGDVTGRIQSNAHLSAANLVKHYFDYGRVMINGFVNSKPKVFKTVLKTKKQVPFAVPVCCDLEPSPFFTYITNLGNNGSLLSSEVNFKTGMVTMEVIHGATGSGFASKKRQFNDSFDQSFG